MPTASRHRRTATPRRAARRGWALLATLAMVLAACSSDGDDAAEPGDGTASGGTGSGGSASDGSTDMNGADFSLFGAPTGVEGEAMQGFIGVYNDETGADISYEGSDSFEEQLRIRVDGGNAPTVAFTPQPGSICDFANAGQLASLEEMGFDIASMETNHGKFWMDLGVCDDGQHYGIPWFPNYKSIVWYRTSLFEDGGYEIPETYDDLVSLSQQMVADGITPWCFGFGSEAASGWPATDWVEDIVVRSAGTDVYTQWFRHEIPFDDPQIVDAVNRFGEIFSGDGFVLGGTQNVAAIDFREAPLPLFNEEGGCAMHKQGSFIANFFPPGEEDEVSFFDFPSIDGNDAAMGGGDTLMVFDPTPQAVQAVKDWITPDWECVLASPNGGTASELGGHGVEGVERLPGHKDVPLDCYETETARQQAEAVRDAIADNTFVFDASDLMPPAVGQGTFWTAMLDWSRGTPADQVLTSVESSWPQS